MLKKISLLLLFAILFSMFSSFSYAGEVPVVGELKVYVDNVNEVITIWGQATPLEQTVYYDIENNIGTYHRNMTNTLPDGSFKTNISFADFKAPAGTYTVWAYNKAGDYRARGQFEYNPIILTPTPTPTRAPESLSLIATYRADNSLTLYGTLSLGAGYLINFTVYDSNGIAVFKDQDKTTMEYYSHVTYIQLKPGTYNVVASVEGTTLKASHPIISKYLNSPTPEPTPTPLVSPTERVDAVYILPMYKYNLVLAGSCTLGKGYLVDLEVFDPKGTSIFKGQTSTREDGSYSLTVDIVLQPGNTYSASASVVGTGLKHSNPFYIKPLVPLPTPIPPVIKGSTLVEANKYGWFNTDVMVHFTGYDPDPNHKITYLTPDITLTGEGNGLIAYGVVVSSSGQRNETWVSGINIDKTPPKIEGYIAQKANSYGWYNTNVDVIYKVSDNLSGVQAVSPVKAMTKEAGETITKEGYGITSKGTAVDFAGNTSQYTVSNINIDKTSPIVNAQILSSSNENGWYNGDVVVHYEGFDNLSGIDTITPDQVVSEEGINLSSTGFGTDKAGNTSMASVYGINIDRTAPDIEVSYPQDGGEYILNQDVKADYVCSDTLSGISQTSSTVEKGASIDTSSVGVKTFKIKVADNAGNESEKTIQYYVRYKFSGLLNSFDLENTALKSSRAIPLAFTLTDALDNTVVNADAGVYIARLVDGTELEETKVVAVNGRDAFLYNPESKEYKFIFKLSSLSAGDWRVKIKMDDMSVHSYDINVYE